jgi:hypothetical protein
MTEWPERISINVIRTSERLHPPLVPTCPDPEILRKSAYNTQIAKLTA